MTSELANLTYFDSGNIVIWTVPWQTRTRCCGHKCFPVCPRAQHLLWTQILCPGHKKCCWFCSETLCVRNKCYSVCAAQEISWTTMCPRLPGPLEKVLFNVLLKQNSVTDVSVVVWPPCWCPSGWAPTWRLHTNLYKFEEKASLHILQRKNCCDLNLGERLCIVIFFLLSDSGLNLLKGLDFYFDLFWMAWLTTSNFASLPARASCREPPQASWLCNFLSEFVNF